MNLGSIEGYLRLLEWGAILSIINAVLLVIVVLLLVADKQRNREAAAWRELAERDRQAQEAVAPGPRRL